MHEQAGEAQFTSHFFRRDVFINRSYAYGVLAQLLVTAFFVCRE